MVVDHPAGTEVFVDERFARQPPPLVVHADRAAVSRRLRPRRSGPRRDRGRRRPRRPLPGSTSAAASTRGSPATTGSRSSSAMTCPATGRSGWSRTAGSIRPTARSTSPSARAAGPSRRAWSWKFRPPTEAGRSRVPTWAFRPARTRRSSSISTASSAPGLPAGSGSGRTWRSSGTRSPSPRPCPRRRLKTQRLAPRSAELRPRGYSLMTQANASSPELPHYDTLAGTSQRWRDLIGFYTRFGDVRELLEKVDDRYVIANAGDELALRFPAPPPPPDGLGPRFRHDRRRLEQGRRLQHGVLEDGASAAVARSGRATTRPPGALEDDPVYRFHPEDWRTYHTRYVTPSDFQAGSGRDRRLGPAGDRSRIHEAFRTDRGHRLLRRLARRAPGAQQSVHARRRRPLDRERDGRQRQGRRPIAAWPATASTCKRFPSPRASISCTTRRSSIAKLDHIMPQIASMGASVAVADFDRDGWHDFYTTDSGEGSRNRLYRNLGDGTFRDVAGVARGRRRQPARHRRLDGLALGRLRQRRLRGPVRLQVGPARAVPQRCRARPSRASPTRRASRRGSTPAAQPGWTSTATAASTCSSPATGTSGSTSGISKTTKMMPESFEYAKNGGRKYLFRNQGDGTFEDVTAAMKIDSHRWALCAAAADLRGTGYPDLFVANDYGVSELFANQAGQVVPRDRQADRHRLRPQERHERRLRRHLQPGAALGLRDEHLRGRRLDPGQQPVGAQGGDFGRDAPVRKPRRLAGSRAGRLELRRPVRRPEQRRHAGPVPDQRLRLGGQGDELLVRVLDGGRRQQRDHFRRQELAADAGQEPLGLPAEEGLAQRRRGPLQRGRPGGRLHRHPRRPRRRPGRLVEPRRARRPGGQPARSAPGLQEHACRPRMPGSISSCTETGPTAAPSAPRSGCSGTARSSCKRCAAAAATRPRTSAGFISAWARPRGSRRPSSAGPPGSVQTIEAPAAGQVHQVEEPQ